MALSNLFPYSFYNAFYFPKKLRLFFLRFVNFENVANKIKERWQKIYQYLLKKASYFMGGRQLILKNPVNTARVKLLLDMFLEAKFIHIYRNPYVVFASTLNFYERAIKPFAL
ncbi:MAG: sulfotransferase, partial [Promethearchaeota archaeon]